MCASTTKASTWPCFLQREPYSCGPEPAHWRAYTDGLQATGEGPTHDHHYLRWRPDGDSDFGSKMSAWEDTLEKLIQRGDWNRSLEHIDRRLLQSDRIDADQTASLLVLRAQLLRELGQCAAAAITFRSAGQLSHSKPVIRLVALFESARELVNLGEYSEAIRILSLALKVVKSQVSESSDDGDAKCMTGEQELVDHGFDPSASPSEVVGKILLLRAQAARLNHDRDLAFQDVSEIIDVLCTSGALRAAALLDRGTIRFENGEPVKAIEDLMAVLVIKGCLPRHKCDALYNLSLIYARDGKYSKLVEAASAFLGSPLPPLQLKRNLAENIQEILANAEADEASAVKEIISSLVRSHK